MWQLRPWETEWAVQGSSLLPHSHSVLWWEDTDSALGSLFLSHSGSTSSIILRDLNIHEDDVSIPVSFWPLSTPVILSSTCLNHPLLYHTWDTFITPCCIPTTVSMSISPSLMSTSDFFSKFPLVPWLHQYIRLGRPIHWPDCSLLPLIFPLSSLLALDFMVHHGYRLLCLNSRLLSYHKLADFLGLVDYYLPPLYCKLLADRTFVCSAPLFPPCHEYPKI